VKTSKLKVRIKGPNNKALTLQGALYEPLTPKTDLTFFCQAGGGLSGDYFNLGQFGGQDYSFASHMTGLGHRVITCDHPGTGENRFPKSTPYFSPRQSALYLSDALEQLRQPLGLKTIIGTGHSMGGMMVTLMEGLRPCFDGLCLMGSNAGGLDWGLTKDEQFYKNKPDDVERDLENLTRDKFGGLFGKIGNGPREGSDIFGGETSEVNARLGQVSCELYNPGGMMSMIRGSFTKEVEAIRLPMLLIAGSRDIGLAPAEAKKDYINAPSIKTLIMPNTGHNSLAFTSVMELCTRLHFWARAI